MIEVEDTVQESGQRKFRKLTSELNEKKYPKEFLTNHTYEERYTLRI